MRSSKRPANATLAQVTFGTGGYNAVKGFGGITACVIEGGRISLQSPFVVSIECPVDFTH